MMELILNFLLCVYGGSVLSCVISVPLYFHLLEKRKKQLGFVNVDGSSFKRFFSSDENNLGALWLLALLIFAFIPGLNLSPFYSLINFEKESDDEIASELKNGQILLKEEVPKDEKEEIARRIIAIRKYQGEMMHKNIPHTYSELTIDQKIAFALHELELLYNEKAKEEGIDLDEKISFCQDKDDKLNQELRRLQKELKNIDMSSK